MEIYLVNYFELGIERQKKGVGASIPFTSIYLSQTPAQNYNYIQEIINSVHLICIQICTDHNCNF